MLLLVLLIGVFVNVATFSGYVFEDAYITYRYAQNIAEGNGFVFNSGERVLGTSTPLYALLLGFLGSLGLDIAQTSGLLFALSLAAIGWLGSQLLLAQGHGIAGIPFALLVSSGFANSLHFWGMETPFYTALLLASTLLASRDRCLASGVCCGLAVLTRYDAVVFAAIVGALLWFKTRRPPWLWCIGAGVVVLPWLLFSTFYFGSALPSTLEAKAGESTFLDYLYSAAALQFEGYSPLRDLSSVGGGAPLVSALWAVLLMAAIPRSLPRLLSRDHFALVLAGFPVLLWIGYGIISPPPEQRWHLVPASIFVLLLSISCWAESLPPFSQYARRLAGVFCLAGVLFIPFAASSQHALLTQNGLYRARPHAYEQMAQWIVAQDLDSHSVLTLEPGYLAYLSRAPMIDRAGLITRGLFFHGSEQRRRGVPELAAALKPGFVIVDEDARLEGYESVLDLFPIRKLLLRSDLADTLSQRSSPVSVDEEATSYDRPLVTSFGEGGRSWRAAGGFIGSESTVVQSPGSPTVFRTAPFGPPWEGAESPRFDITFDELAFSFLGTHSNKTVAQLVIGGRVVLQENGDGSRKEVVWPLYPWRGMKAVLRVADIGPRTSHLELGKIRSRPSRNGVALPGTLFERRALSVRQAQSVAASPNRHLVPLASTIGDSDVTLESRPFVLSGDILTIFVADDGTPADAVQLVVNGTVRREYKSKGSRRLEPLDWGVKNLRGRTATLRLVDLDGTQNRGLGVVAPQLWTEPRKQAEREVTTDSRLPVR